MPKLKPSEHSDIDTLVRGLEFSVENVVGASAEQARLFLLAANHRVQMMRNRCRAEAAYEVAKADKAAFLRKNALDTGAKITENGVAEALTRDSKLKPMAEELSECEASEELSKLLVDAYRMRRDSLRIIADMVGFNIGAGAAQEEGDRRMNRVMKDIRTKYPES